MSCPNPSPPCTSTLIRIQKALAVQHMGTIGDSTVATKLEFDAFSCNQSSAPRGGGCCVILARLSGWLSSPTSRFDSPRGVFEVKHKAEPTASWQHKKQRFSPLLSTPQSHVRCQESSSSDSISSFLTANPHQAVTLISQNAARA